MWRCRALARIGRQMEARWLSAACRPARRRAVAAFSTEAATAPGLSCSGCFFSLDPNIGLGRDKINPSWRLSFTDRRTGELQRVPYKVDVDLQGPHAALEVRMEAGLVSCTGNMPSVPERLDAISGWEVSLPVYVFSSVGLAKTVLRADFATGPVDVVVWRLAQSPGFALGYHAVVAGGSTGAGPPKSESIRTGFAKLYFFFSVISTLGTPLAVYEFWTSGLTGGRTPTRTAQAV
mmetsp:Transcript_46427/g.104330  ORF Transcript_46427/g.104330 Transcript_46427/m.104330 type:complete len:235 (-) Transcript_46427:23-727(-)